MKHVFTTLDELKVNPFADRLCQVFAQNGDFLLFEEFLDMMSVEGVGQEKGLRLENKEVNSVVENLLKWTDINRTGYIYVTEFKQSVTK